MSTTPSGADALRNQYRKKPVVIEAVQFTEEVRDAFLFDKVALPVGVEFASSSTHPPTRTVRSAHFYIQTLEGRMEVSVGDWIITGVKGEKYPCKPDIFAATYELALASAQEAPAQAMQAVPDDMDAVAVEFAHRLALDLECVLVDYGGKWYDKSIATLSGYRDAMNAISERESPTFLGEPVLAAAPAAPAAPPEAQTLAERQAYAFGWFKGQEAMRDAQAAPAAQEPSWWTADDLKEPKNGKAWRVHWWNESARLMLPADSVLDSYQVYKNGTLQFTIKSAKKEGASK